MKRFLLIGGIVAGVGISIVIIQAASLLPNSSSAALKKITAPTMPKIIDTKLQDLSRMPTDVEKSVENTAKESTAKTPSATTKNTGATQTPLSPEKLIPLSEVLELKKVVLPLEDIILTPKQPENTVILEKIISEDENEEKNAEIFLTVTELFRDVNPSSSAYQAIIDIINLMKQQGNFILPASKKFKPRNKLRPSFAAQIALSLTGESCGIGKGATRARTCLARAYELGLFEKNALADKPMTRGDFYELLLAVLKIPAVESTEGLLCQDVDNSHAYAEIVATAKQYGIARRYRVKGKGGYCLPNAPLTKADAAVIASKALEAAKQKLGR